MNKQAKTTNLSQLITYLVIQKNEDENKDDRTPFYQYYTSSV